MLSSRLDFRAANNRWSEILAEKRKAGVRILDLSESNPTSVGLDYPEGWARALAGSGAQPYEPTPRGLRSARQAVADYYAEKGAFVDPESIVLCASTSEAYALLLKLLCDPGDVVLAPQPSYPLIEPIAMLEGVRLERYRLRYDGAWHIALGELRTRIEQRTRAIVLVNPNNPTGSYVKRRELEALESAALEHDLALISDEVFSDCARGPDPERVAMVAAATRAPCFSLGGLSKLAGLPQVKVAWIVVGGPARTRCEILGALEHVNDTYLSCSGPAQHALAGLLDLRHSVGAQIAARVGENRAWLAQSGAEVLADEGGWYGVLRLPAGVEEEALALKLLAQHDVLVHPGYLYDFVDPGFVVVSLLLLPSTFRDGVARLLEAARVG